MNLITWFLSIFWCQHERYTWPQTTEAGTNVSCLDCGKTLPYRFKALGGMPARTRRAKVTAPRRLILETPGKVQVVIGEDRHIQEVRDGALVS